jgi:hypothetical protein
MLSSPYCIVLFDIDDRKEETSIYEVMSALATQPQRCPSQPVDISWVASALAFVPVHIRTVYRCLRLATRLLAATLVPCFCADLQSVERLAGVGRDRRGARCRPCSRKSSEDGFFERWRRIACPTEGIR